MDVASFGNTAFDNPAVDAMTFRDQGGNPVHYNTGALPKASPLWSPRVGFNYDLASDQQTQIRGGTGVFTAKPPYVWISNQIGNTGVLTGFLQTDNTTAYPFSPNADKYKVTNVTGAGAASYELDVTDPNFKFPQTWRTNIGVDRRLPWGLVGTVDYIYNRDLNDPFYINANLPAPSGAFTGIDNRIRWSSTAGPGISTVYPACAAAGQAGPCVGRINNATGNQVTSAYVIKNTDQNRSWNISTTLTRTFRNGWQARGGYSYGVAKGIVEPGSTASSSWGSNANPGDPNNPPLQYSSNSPGHRVYWQATYSHPWVSWGATTISAFWDGHTGGNTSYVFSGDANTDGFTGNDLIYIPRNQSEMNFVQNGAFTPAQQAAAFDAYISQDPYLSQHRGEYAVRGAVFLPFYNRVDLSITQDVFKEIGGRKHSGQIRLDMTNFGNLLNKNWGVSQRLIQSQVLTSAGPDANGALSYRLTLVNNQLPTTSYQSSTSIDNVYVLMLSFRYTFQ
jgi:hypothetical protein